MRMKRSGLAMLVASIGMGAMGISMNRLADTTSLFGSSLKSTKKHKNKPNKLSQKKRRLNARRLGKFK